MIEYIFLTRNSHRDQSLELNYASQKLSNSLPKSATVMHLDAENTIKLWLKAANYLEKTRSPTGVFGGCSMLLSSPYLYLTSEDIQTLAEVCTAECGPVFAPSNLLPLWLPPRDYFTIRGLERYKQQLSHLASFTSSVDEQMAVICLPTQQIFQDPYKIKARCLPGNFTHDFGGYQSGARDDVLELIPPNSKSLLDVGGGEGFFLNALSRRMACKTHLCEISPAACEIAKTNGNADKLWPGDFLLINFDQTFECITFLDVLEHVSSPEEYLEKAIKLLSPSGVIVCSIPNVGHWSCVLDLIEGRWDYAPAGIHCATHVRFFTPHSIRSMFEGLALEIVEWVEVKAPAPDTLDLTMLQRNFSVNQNSLDTYAIHAVVRPRK